MGGGKARAGKNLWGHSGVPATPPSLPPQTSPGHYGLGGYDCRSAGPPMGGLVCPSEPHAGPGVRWPQEWPQVASKPQESSRLARRWQLAWKMKWERAQAAAEPLEAKAGGVAK